MVRRFHDLEMRLREISSRRDRRLESHMAMPAERLQRLRAVLASKLPLETALSHAATKRDEMLPAGVSVIPTHVQVALAERMMARVGGDRSGQLVICDGKIRRTVWRLAYSPRALALAAAVALFAAGFLLISQWGTRGSRAGVTNAPPKFALSDAITARDVFQQVMLARLGDSFIPSSDNRLTLNISTTELALLQPSLLTARYLLERHDADLPLDLPIRQSVMNAEAARTP